MTGADTELIPRPPSVVDRYFKKRYKTDLQGKVGEDQLVLTHSNRICVICIANSHPVIAESKVVTKVSFEGGKWNRLDNTVSGKNKRGAQWLERSAPLCCLTCSDGSMYTLRCCVKGQLVEINTKLIDKPDLLTAKPLSEGYLAVILPGLKGFDREVDHLKSEEAYRAVLDVRLGVTAEPEQEGSPSVIVPGQESSLSVNGPGQGSSESVNGPGQRSSESVNGPGQENGLPTDGSVGLTTPKEGYLKEKEMQISEMNH